MVIKQQNDMGIRKRWDKKKYWSDWKGGLLKNRRNLERMKETEAN